MATNTPLYIFRGDTTFIDVTAIGTDGEPFNLNNCSMWFSLKRSLADADEDALVSKTLIDGILIVDAVEGLATVVIDPEDTEALGAPALGLYWDVQVKDASNSVYTIARGTMNVLADVTRSSA